MNIVEIRGQISGNKTENETVGFDDMQLTGKFFPENQ